MKYKIEFTSPISDTLLQQVFMAESEKEAKKRFRKEWGRWYKIISIMVEKEQK